MFGGVPKRTPPYVLGGVNLGSKKWSFSLNARDFLSDGERESAHSGCFQKERQKSKAGSVKLSFGRCEWTAVLVAAFLVLFPLSIHPAMYLVNIYRHPDSSKSHDLAALIGWLTLGAIVFQAWTSRVQAKISARQADLMEKQAAIAERQARAAELQTKVLLQQTDLLRKQKEIARQGHLIVHRPRMIVRAVEIARARAGRDPTDLLYADFIITNIGESAAEIVAIGFMVKRRSNALSEILVEEFMRNPIDSWKKFEAGSSVKTNICDTCTYGEFGEIYERRDLLNYIVFAGAILYKDELGVMRRTHVWRKLDYVSMQFVPSTNREYEYAD